MPTKTIIRAATIGVLAGLGTARGAVVTDGSIGAARTFGGRNVVIPASAGGRSRDGVNLFHSFRQFDVPQGGRVTFSGPASVRNILARVTGGAASQIDGTLASSISGANLYLINPAGVVFGKTAALNVSGTFTATTADVVRLTHHATFPADVIGDGVLRGGDVSGFGFLTARPATIRLDGCTLNSAGRGVRLAATAVSLVGATVACPSGQISVAAVRNGDAAIAADTADVVPVADAELGPVALSASSLLTDGGGGGRIDLHAGTLALNAGSVLGARSNGLRTGRGISVTVGDNLTVADSTIDASTHDAGSGGEIDISARRVNLRNDARVLAGSNSTGQGGSVFVSTHALLLQKDLHAPGPSPVISVDTQAGGAAGDVRIRAGAITLDGGDIVAGSRGTFGNAPGGVTANGPGGDLRLSADSLQIVHGGSINATTAGAGAAGNITLKVGDIRVVGQARSPTGVSVESQAPIDPARPAATPGGPAGHIAIVADELAVDTGLISSTTRGSGAGGAVDIRAHAVTVTGGEEGLFTGILSESFSTDAGGNAGPVTVNAGQLNITNGGTISSATFGVGNAGRLTVNADRMAIDGSGNADPTGLNTASINSVVGGTAGSVDVTVGTLRIASGGVIRTSTAGQAVAGTVTVNAADSLSIAGDGGVQFTGIDSGSIGVNTGGGRAGDVRVSAPQLSISSGGLISSGTNGQGRSGDVTVRADVLLIDRDGASRPTGISTGTSTRKHGGMAGDINVTARDAMAVVNGGAVTVASGGSGGAGNLTVTTTDLRVTGPSALSASATGSGPAGNVLIHAGQIGLTGSGTRGDGGVFARTGFGGGAGGNVKIEAGRLTADHEASISAQTIGNGDAGNVRLHVNDIDLADHSALLSDSRNAGRAGSVKVDCDNLRLSGGASIATSGEQTRAGDLIVTATHGIDALDSTLSARSGAGDSGNVTLTAVDHISLVKSTVTARAGANGAQLTLDPLVVVLNHATLDGRSGLLAIPVKVKIDAGAALVKSLDSVILSNDFSLPPDVDLTGVIAHFPEPTFGGQTVLSEGCEMQFRKRGLSSFILRERLGLPPVAGQMVLSGVVVSGK